MIEWKKYGKMEKWNGGVMEYRSCVKLTEFNKNVT
jgi:hypothetical protein